MLDFILRISYIVVRSEIIGHVKVSEVRRTVKNDFWKYFVLKTTVDPMNCYVVLSLFLYFTSIASYTIYPHSSNTALKLKTAVLWGVILLCLVMVKFTKNIFIFG